MPERLALVVATSEPCVRHACPGPCCDLNEVPLLDSDILRLERATGRPRAYFVESTDGWRLLRGAGTLVAGCVFKGPVAALAFRMGCTVHAARPTACRTYPYVLDDTGRARTDPHCEHAGDFTPPPGAMDTLRRLQAELDHERADRQAAKETTG